MLGISRGAANNGVGGSPPSSDVSASISPDVFRVFCSNGSYTTPEFKSNVTNGVGPFIYSWKVSEGDVLSPAAKKTRLRFSGYNQEVQAVLELTVTDTGDSNKKATATALVIILFEDGLFL